MSPKEEQSQPSDKQWNVDTPVHNPLHPRVVRRLTNLHHHNRLTISEDTSNKSSNRENEQNSSGSPSHSDGDDSETQQHLWAGAVAGMVADSIMHPFDTLSTRVKVQDGTSSELKYKGLIQTTRTIVKEEGFWALYNGLSAAMLSTIPSTALYFATYEAVKKEGSKRVPETAMPLVHLVAGAASELSSLFVAVPFEVVKCRMQLGENPYKVTNGAVPMSKNYHSAFHGLTCVWKTEGIAGLYAGLRPCIVLDCCFSAVQFALYEKTKKVLTNHRAASSAQRPPWTSAADDLVAGSFAGGCAALLTNPLDVVTTRIMTQVEGDSASLSRSRVQYRGTWHCLQTMVKSEGVNALWFGSAARVLSIMPLSGLTFAVYEHMKRMINTGDD